VFRRDRLKEEKIIYNPKVIDSEAESKDVASEGSTVGERGPIEDESMLRNLSVTYALAADAHDGRRFSSVFADGGSLTVRSSSRPELVLTAARGSDELAEIPAKLERAYERTFHFLGQYQYIVNGHGASGITYCQAGHLSIAGDDVRSHHMYLRYEDRYRRRGEAWEILDRTVWIDWTETVAADPVRR